MWGAKGVASRIRAGQVRPLGGVVVRVVAKIRAMLVNVREVRVDVEIVGWRRDGGQLVQGLEEVGLVPSVRVLFYEGLEDVAQLASTVAGEWVPVLLEETD